MGFFDKLKEPVFLKESSDALRQLEVLKALESRLTTEGQEKIRQDMKYLEYGIQGENQIAFELKHSHMPMYVLHDIYLEDGDLNAQIDYLVITRKICFIIECKNLFGNIEINSNGDFIRTMDFGGHRKKEGIYSPITQNQRHLELLRKIKTESRDSWLAKQMTSKHFEDFHKAIVVLANPKTVLNDKYAKKDIKKKVIRADQLTSYIAEQCRMSDVLEQSDEKLKNWAESFLKLHKEVEKDYTGKYQQYLIQDPEKSEFCHNTEKHIEESSGATESSSQCVTRVNKTDSIEDSALFMELKSYRLQKSREEQIKPYYIYNNDQLKDLIDQMPDSKQALQKVSGFGPVKAEKYGDDILAILSRHKNS